MPPRAASEPDGDGGAASNDRGEAGTPATKGAATAAAATTAATAAAAPTAAASDGSPPAAGASSAPSRQAPVDSLGWRLGEDGLWYPPAPEAPAAGEAAAPPPQAELPWKAESDRRRPARWIIAAVVVAVVAGTIALLTTIHSNPNAIDKTALNNQTTTSTTSGATSTTGAATSTTAVTTTTVPGSAAVGPPSAELCSAVAAASHGTAKLSSLNGAFTLSQYSASSLSAGAADVGRLTSDHFVRGCALTAALPERHAGLGVLVLEFESHLQAHDYAHYTMNVTTPAVAGAGATISPVTPLPGDAEGYLRTYSATSGTTTLAVATTTYVQGNLVVTVGVASKKQPAAYLALVAALKTARVAKALPPTS